MIGKVGLRRIAVVAVTLAGAVGAAVVGAYFPLTRTSSRIFSRTVTLESLLSEMLDRDAVARWPDPPYSIRLACSTSPNSERPEPPRPMPFGWYDNDDRGQSWWIEDGPGRKEWILMAHEGPGAIVRMQAPEWNVGTIRVYLDDRDDPVIRADFSDLLMGRRFVKPPFAYNTLESGNFYLPIPFAKRCKITVDRTPLFHEITYRVYPEGTRVETFTMAGFESARQRLRRAKQELEAPRDFRGGKSARIEQTIAPGSEASVDLPEGPSAVRHLEVRLPMGATTQALRSTILRIRFDGEETVWAPLGDFFGCGVGLNPHEGWHRRVDADGTMLCRWVMPYQRAGSIALSNLGDAEVAVEVEAAVGRWRWDERSMLFHANWRQEYPIATRPFRDWNYIEIEGRGVYVGDTLAVVNHASRWWGEGDERIYVDGETFPSIFGAGTEDYYGYSWGDRNTDVFDMPFHAQVRAGRGTLGHNTVTRTMCLDAIPFRSRLKFDMEIWHVADTRVGYAATTYWYALPGATSNRGPEVEEASRAPQAIHPPASTKSPS